MITRIDRSLLDAVSAAAAASPRRRKNRNFHPADDFPAHRMLNALEPDSYVVPHCHRDPAKDESMSMIAVYKKNLDGTLSLISKEMGEENNNEVLREQAMKIINELK